MWRAIFGLFLILSTYLGVDYFWNHRVYDWKIQTQSIVLSAQEAGLNQDKWQSVGLDAEKLPNFYPFSTIKNIFPEVDNIFGELKAAKDFELEFGERSIDIKSVWVVFDHIRNIQESVDNIRGDISYIPGFLLEEDQKLQKAKLLEKLDLVEEQIEDLLKFEQTLKYFADRNERILVLLQNQNEPRSTGGFTGSIVIMDFKGDKIGWRFSDIYALDRKIDQTLLLPAPEFFHNLSKTISLRDANFWPNFPTTARQYRYFFEMVEEKVPGTIIAINLNTIEEVLKVTGPVKFEEWGMTLDAYNFDLGLQFLVESKIAGRYDVKKPIEFFADELLAELDGVGQNIDAVRAFDWKKFIAEKNILAHTQNRSLQKLFEKWNVAGRIHKQKEADNFLYFDFVSVGANKSDKFLWTKIWHDSAIDRTGKVRNFLKIKRTHALHENEIQDLLGFNGLSENVRDLLNGDLLWKLGAGENRTIMRVYVPKDAVLISQNTPSGDIKSYIDSDTGFRIFEFPVNVLPGEKIATKIEYETQINRGSHAWRPYFLEVLGTPGREKTEILETISTVEGDTGKFSAETLNIGRPEPLIDQEYRAVIEWETKAE